MRAWRGWRPGVIIHAQWRSDDGRRSGRDAPRRPTFTSSEGAMTGPRHIEHKGTRVILLDFAGVHDAQEGLRLIAESARFVQSGAPDGSGFTCSDVTNTRYDRQIVDAFKVMASGNRPYIKAAAVVSDSSIHRAAISMIALFSRRKIQSFNSRAEALDWLVAQR
jgi:hypothetical protein